MKANVFIGEVIERAVETPREMSITKKIGVASPLPTWRGRSLGAQVSSMNPTFNSVASQIPVSDEPLVLSNDERSTIDSDASMKQIMQMSPEELQVAQREIAAMFKPENLAYLQKMATKGSSSCDDPKISERRKLSECKASRQVEGSDDCLVTDTKKVAIAKVMKPAGKDIEVRSVLSSRPLMRSSKDRFDLRGCKVVQKQSCITDVAAALQENTMFLDWKLPSSAFTSIATICVDSMLDAGFAVEHIPVHDSQPQDELLNHQMDSDEPGYNMTEICELSEGVTAESKMINVDDIMNSDYGRLQMAFSTVYNHAVMTIAQFISSSSGKSPEECSLLLSQWIKKLAEHDEAARLRRVLVYVLLILCASDLPTGLPTLLVWGTKLPRVSPTIAVSTLRCLREYVSSGLEENAAERLWDAFWGSSGCPSLPMPHTRRPEMSYEKHIEDCFDNRRDALEEEQKAAEEDAQGVKEVEGSRRSFVETFALRCRWGRVDSIVGEGVVTVLCAHIVAGAQLYETQKTSDSSTATAISASTTTTTTAVIATANTVSTSVPKSRERERERDSAAVLLLQSASIALEVLHSICRLCDQTQIGEVTIQIIKIWRSCLCLLDEDDMTVGVGNTFEGVKGGLCCGWWRVIAELCRRRRDFAMWICEPGQDSMTPKCLILLLKSNDDTLARKKDNNDLKMSSNASALRAALKSQQQPWDCVVWAMRVWRVCAAYGQGLTSVSELLLAAQLEGRTCKSASKDIKSPNGGAIPVPSTSTSTSTSMSSGFLYSAARALGPGIASRVWSLDRLCGMMWLLEQAAVSCAAMIHAHTVKEINKEEVQDAEASRTASSTPSSSSSISPTEDIREIEEMEEVGRALETARLLLGVAEKLLPSVIKLLESQREVEKEGEGEGVQQGYPDAFHRGLDCDVTPLVIASTHFLTSLLGNWQAEVPQGNGPQQGNRFGAFRLLEQHSSRHYHHPLVPIDSTTATANTVSSMKGHQGGVGLLQSCVMYALYVRTSSARQHLNEEKVGKDGNNESLGSDDVEVKAKEGSKEVVKDVKRQAKMKQFQFAVLHHLESKILSFIGTSFTETLLMTLHKSVLRSANDVSSYQSNHHDHDHDHSDSTTCAFNDWLSEERSGCILQLLSSSLSYSRFLSNALTLTDDVQHAHEALHRLTYAAAAERIMSRQPVQPCTVAEGLYCWQSNRLAQVALLTDLQLLCVGYRTGIVSRECVISCSLRSLHSMGHGMKASVVQIAHTIIDLINIHFGGDKASAAVAALPSLLADNIVPFSASASEQILKDVTVKTGNLIDDALKGRLLLHILGPKDSADKAISYSECSVVLTSSESAKPRNLTDWKEVCIDSYLPVPVDWALRGLQAMEGDGFEKWLIVLSTVQNLSVSTPSQDLQAMIKIRSKTDGNKPLHERPFTLLNSSAVSNIYALLQLTCLDQAHRWKVLTPDTGLTESAEDNEECMIVSDFSDASAAAYCSLLASCSWDIAQQQASVSRMLPLCRSSESSSEVKGGESYCEQFVTIAQQSVNSSRTISSRKVKALVPVKGGAREEDGPSFGYGVKMEAGVMDLAGKLLDALTSQSICEDVHCVSVLCLLSPWMSPWRVRERVWRELGQIRLLHLLEHEELILSMIGLLHFPQEVMGLQTGVSPTVTGRGSRDGSSKTMLLVSKDILEALCILRADEDKDWMLVSVGLYHIAASIFSKYGNSASSCMTTPQFRALTNMVSDCSIADWVVYGVFQAADRFFGCDAATDEGTIVPCKEEEKEEEGKKVEAIKDEEKEERKEMVGYDGTKQRAGAGQVQGLTGLQERFKRYHAERISSLTPLTDLALLDLKLPAPPVSSSVTASVPVPEPVVIVGQNEGVRNDAVQAVQDTESTLLKDLLLVHRPLMM